MSAPSEAAEPVSRFLPLTMASALFMDLLDTAALGSALPTTAAVGIVTLIVLSESVGSELLSRTGSLSVAAAALAAWIIFILVTALAVPVYTRLAAQAGAHMRNAGKASP
jgi:hypothetical protein